MTKEEIVSRQIFSITFPEYIGCRHSGTLGNETPVDNYQINKMSHFCLNGSLSYLDEETWGKYCHPYHEEYHQNFDKMSILAGIFGLVTFIVGVFGNLFTLVAVTYAKWKCRHEFHHSF